MRMTAFQERLRWVLEKREESGRALAEKAELAPSHVNGLLKQARDPNITTIEKIAKAAGVSAAWLAFGHGRWDDGADVPRTLLEAIQVGQRWSAWTVEAVMRRSIVETVHRSVAGWAAVLDRWEAVLSRAIDDDASRDRSSPRIKV